MRNNNNDLCLEGLYNNLVNKASDIGEVSVIVVIIGPVHSVTFDLRIARLALIAPRHLPLQLRLAPIDIAIQRGQLRLDCPEAEPIVLT